MRRIHLTQTADLRLNIHLLPVLLMTLLVACDNYSAKNETDAVDAQTRAVPPLHILVMDPLAEPFACACVPPTAHHLYTGFQQTLSRQLKRQVTAAYAESLTDTAKGQSAPHLIIGKCSWVAHQAQQIDLPLTHLAMLTDHHGKTELRGLFLVRRDDSATAVGDLQNHRILLGPKGLAEKHRAAIKALSDHNIDTSHAFETHPRCTGAALAVAENEVDATVISDYAAPILDNGKFFPSQSLKIVGRTDPVPFIGLFATPELTPDEARTIAQTILTAEFNESVAADLKSQKGFVPPHLPTNRRDQSK